ncbi:MAG: hypothetical protein GEV08_14015 [Acidimicrobiia bacterium]|nr:hypothetical protein [Acidimicrobiia bacterium]
MVCDGRRCTELRAPHIDSVNVHGTGCSFASPVAAGLARRLDVDEASGAAKAFVHRAIAGSARWRLGAGHGTPRPLRLRPGGTHMTPTRTKTREQGPGGISVPFQTGRAHQRRPHPSLRHRRPRIRPHRRAAAPAPRLDRRSRRRRTLRWSHRGAARRREGRHLPRRQRDRPPPAGRATPARTCGARRRRRRRCARTGRRTVVEVCGTPTPAASRWRRSPPDPGRGRHRD